MSFELVILSIYPIYLFFSARGNLEVEGEKSAVRSRKLGVKGDGEDREDGEVKNQSIT